MRAPFLSPLTALLLALAVTCAACGEDTEGACDRIAEACHDVDTGSGPAFECHTFAEAEGVTDAQCAEKEDECHESCEH